jgi:hypothetical protein
MQKCIRNWLNSSMKTMEESKFKNVCDENKVKRKSNSMGIKRAGKT